MRAPDADVAVIGAGPSGAVAACVLARAGRSALLLDPQVDAASPDKPGDALPSAALRLLQACALPLPQRQDGHRPNGGNISVWGSAEPVYRDFLAEPDGAGWRLDRHRFESGLIAAARTAGAAVQSRGFRDVQRDGALWLIRLRDGGAASVRWLVDATGRAASVARRLGARRHRDEAIVAVVGYGQPDPRFTLERSMVETVRLGWWYAALLPDHRPVFMLHTTPQDAARLRAAPEQWLAALKETHHVARAFPQPALAMPLRGYEACGAWLEQVHGDGWVACGDAALSFDPCAAQGIFSALYCGMAVGHALHSALRGDTAALAAYAAQCGDIRRTYRQQLQAHYAQERRWPDTAFWRASHGRISGRDNVAPGTASGR